jgi:hypothetical protein
MAEAVDMTAAAGSWGELLELLLRDREEELGRRSI